MQESSSCMRFMPGLPQQVTVPPHPTQVVTLVLETAEARLRAEVTARRVEME